MNQFFFSCPGKNDFLSMHVGVSVSSKKNGEKYNQDDDEKQ